MNLSHVLVRVCAASLVAALAACAPSQPRWPEEGGSRAGFSVNPSDFNGISLKPHAPRDGQPLMDSLADSHAIDLLHQDLELFKLLPRNIRLRVVGHTDSLECSADDCNTLSLRRARSLHRWYVEHGVDPSGLEAPAGFGERRPIDVNSTERGRASNRRAYVSYEMDEQ